MNEEAGTSSAKEHVADDPGNDGDVRAQARAGAHRDRLTALCAGDGPLTAAGATASVRNPAWFRQAGGVPQPRATRRDLHARLVTDAEARHPEVRQDRQAIVLAGPPGAGKSTVQRELVNATGTHPEHWRVINSDDFKDDLLEEALRDGSYHRWLLPAELAELEATGERFHPRELASLVHQESGLLAQHATARAIERGDNLVIDGTLSNELSAHRLVEQLDRAGYQVHIVDVEAPREVVEVRIAARWRAGYLAAETGSAPSEQDARLGGRWVPPAFAASLFPGQQQESVCAAVARAVAERHPAVREYTRYQVPGPDEGPRPVERRGRVGTAVPLLDAETYAAMRTAQASRSTATARPRQAPRQAGRQDRDRGRD